MKGDDVSLMFGPFRHADDPGVDLVNAGCKVPKSHRIEDFNLNDGIELLAKLNPTERLLY